MVHSVRRREPQRLLGRPWIVHRRGIVGDITRLVHHHGGRRRVAPEVAPWQPDPLDSTVGKRGLHS